MVKFEHMYIHVHVYCMYKYILYIIIHVLYMYMYVQYMTCLFLNRLVNGLSSEKVRWGESVGSMKEEEKLLPGDVLLTASYLSYVGCFGKNYRVDLLENKWLPYLESLDVGYTRNVHVHYNFY